MTGLKTAAVAAGFVTAAALGAALAPAAHGQAAVARAPRAVDVFAGGSRIGVSIRDVESTDAAARGASGGVLVEEVTAGSPAEKAGVRKGDVIVEFDGERVRSVRQLTRLVQETPSGRGVPAVLLREGQRTTVTVTPRDDDRFSYRFEDLQDLARDMRRRLPAPPPPPAAPARPGEPAPPVPPAAPPEIWSFDGFAGRATARLGVTLNALSPQLAEYFGTKDGVLVTSVSDGSAAAKAGIKAGDVITAVNGAAVTDPADVRRQIQDVNDGDEVTIELTRDRKSMTLKATLERTERRRTGRTVL